MRHAQDIHRHGVARDTRRQLVELIIQNHHLVVVARVARLADAPAYRLQENRA
ncbi:hypothetical protein GRH90_03290 [Enterobacteriales bacterium SAP-6]|uniref:Uncharacterized protein n=1 Tax=Acerihabitans arboris TaxID=2691583 RepID=A0A845SEI9_9GAMM|nr:hypothetical protein [Acerihabitans arboris]